MKFVCTFALRQTAQCNEKKFSSSYSALSLPLFLNSIPKIREVAHSSPQEIIQSCVDRTWSYLECFDSNVVGGTIISSRYVDFNSIWIPVLEMS